MPDTPKSAFKFLIWNSSVSYVTQYFLEEGRILDCWSYHSSYASYEISYSSDAKLILTLSKSVNSNDSASSKIGQVLKKHSSETKLNFLWEKAFFFGSRASAQFYHRSQDFLLYFLANTKCFLLERHFIVSEEAQSIRMTTPCYLSFLKNETVRKEIRIFVLKAHLNSTTKWKSFFCNYKNSLIMQFVFLPRFISTATLINFGGWSLRSLQIVSNLLSLF